MRLLTVLIHLLLLASATSSYAAVGKIEQQLGIGQISRGSSITKSSTGTPIEMLDKVETSEGIIGIGFDDKTKVRIDKHSKLLIDSFVYDPKKPTNSKLGLNVAFGTVKYASGLIAKNNQQSVSIKTPTASISVRGTAFSMTVDEIGKSLIILLPNSDGTVGEILVESDVGQVILNQAFQATSVGATESKPTPPVILDLNETQISNLLIITKPKEKDSDDTSEQTNNVLDFNELDIDLLKNDELEKDQLEFTRLDVNLLDVDFLGNILDTLNKTIFKVDEGVVPDPIRAGVYEQGKIQIVKDDETIIYRNFDNNIISVTTTKDNDLQVDVTQNGSQVIFNNIEGAGNDSKIIINQR